MPEARPPLTRVNWSSNQPTYGTSESRRSAPQPDHRRTAQRDPEARDRRGIGTAHCRRGEPARRTRPPLFRFEGRPLDRDRRAGRGGLADAAPCRARRPRSGARTRARARLPVHRISRRSRTQRSLRRDQRRRPTATSAAEASRRTQRRDRGRAHRLARSAARLSGPPRRERRPRHDAHLPAVRRRCRLAA